MMYFGYYTYKYTYFPLTTYETLTPSNRPEVLLTVYIPLAA